MNAAPERIVIAKHVNQVLRADGNALVLDFEELRKEIRSGRILKRLLRYRESELYADSIEYLAKPFSTALTLRLLARRSSAFTDTQGQRVSITLGKILALATGMLRDALAKNGLLRKVRADLQVLESAEKFRPSQPPDPALAPIYLRTDFSYGIVSGGSVGHIGGVLNNLDAFFAKPLFITSDAIPNVREDLPQLRIRPGHRYLDFRELPTLDFNYSLMERIDRELPAQRPAFLYQRYSLNNFTGIQLARRLRVPFVLEFNGSEIWVGRNWGKVLVYEALSARIESLNLAAADLVVVVSQPLKDTLVKQGVLPEKILVNPNGVNPDAYSPGISGAAVRTKLGLEGKRVYGFIGTFGNWHGAEVLAEAFGRMVRARPDLRAGSRLLLIGDGVRLPQVKEAIERHGIGDISVLTGLIPQKQGPAHLAACDILVSPHVPNPDGSAFFGSPTKLFEYMAMGKGIVASDLDQIGEILEHGKSAWMTRPGDPDSLAEGMAALADDPALCARLGQAAREEVVAKFTWREHTRKIVERLGELCR